MGMRHLRAYTSLERQAIRELTSAGLKVYVGTDYFKVCSELREAAPSGVRLKSEIKSGDTHGVVLAQHPLVARYVVDFFWLEESLVIEINGKWAHGTKKKGISDASRRTKIIRAGFKILTIEEHQMGTLRSLVEKIRKENKNDGRGSA